MCLKRIVILLIPITFIVINSYGQIQQDSVIKRRNIFPIWTFHSKNTTIYGVSLGLWSYSENLKFTNTNGLKLELIGLGFVLPLIPESPVAESEIEFDNLKNDTMSETINGISLSATGAFCDCIVNGISAGFIGQFEHKVNGVSASFLININQIHNGVQIGFINETYKMRGIQIGGINKSSNTRGIQIGIWNINEKRKFPLINWNFRPKKDKSENGS
jgi:hypothetical protein